MAWERVGAALSLPFAGVHIVEATKQVYRAIPAHRERTRLIPSLRAGAGAVVDGARSRGESQDEQSASAVPHRLSIVPAFGR